MKILYDSVFIEYVYRYTAGTMHFCRIRSSIMSFIEIPTTKLRFTKFRLNRCSG